MRFTVHVKMPSARPNIEIGFQVDNICFSSNQNSQATRMFCWLSGSVYKLLAFAQHESADSQSTYVKSSIQ